MGMGQKLVLLTGAAIVATAASAQPAGQKVTGPVAVYWMSAATQSGMGMPGMGGPGSGGGRPSAAQMMAMINGGGGAQHSLTLQLGSTQKPTGAPSAEHLPPQTLGAGASLPLVSPEPVAPSTRPEPEEQPAIPREYQKPRGRMLIFWGCGDHAKARPAPGHRLRHRWPPAMLRATPRWHGDAGHRASASPRAHATALGAPASPTYGDWPNAQSPHHLCAGARGSLVGAHTIHGDYSPEIKFTLAATQDFLGPLTLTTNAKTPAGAVQLGWGAVSGAQAYAATVIGASSAGRGRGGDDATVVLWSSSETQAAAFALPDYISPGDLTRGVESHALMDAQATSCTVPKEVVDASPQGFLQMAAYGGEANFVYPPRPTDPKVAWNQQWQVKVRYRSATGGLLGMTMPTMWAALAAAAPPGDGAIPLPSRWRR